MYSSLSLRKNQGGPSWQWNASFVLANTGKTTGSEVVQLYLQFPDKTEYPFSQLRGFEKVTLAPGAMHTVVFTMDQRWLSSWDISTHSFKLNKGEFGVAIGGASDDIKLTSTFEV